MKRNTWAKAFGLSVVIHVFIVIAVGYCMRMGEGPTVQQMLASCHIEVELEAYGSGNEPGDTLQEPRLSQGGDRARARLDTKPLPTRPERREPLQSDMTEITSQETGVAAMGHAVAVSEAGEGVSENLSANGLAKGGLATGVPGGAAKGNGAAGHSSGRINRVTVLDGPPPEYPLDARSQGWEGTVRVRVLISEQGKVKESAVAHSSGYDSIDQAALKGIYRWRFSPAYQNGRTVPAWVVVPVVFKLE